MMDAVLTSHRALVLDSRVVFVEYPLLRLTDCCLAGGSVREKEDS